MNNLEYERAVIGAIMTEEKDGDVVGVYAYRHGWSLITEILESVRRTKGEDVERKLILEFGLGFHGYD